MKREKQIIMPKLSNCGGDITRQWFIYYSYRDNLTGQMKRFRVYDGFTNCKTEAEKCTHARKLIIKWRKKLLAGYNPFTDTKKYIYSDNLTYCKNNTHPHTRSGRKTVRHHLNKYLEQRKSSLAESTYRKYQSQFRILNTYLETRNLSHLDITIVDKKTAQAFIQHLINNRASSGKTCNTYITLLTSVWTHAAQENPLILNPWKTLHKHRETTHPQKPIKKALINVIRNDLQVNNPQLWLAAQFQYYCFIRPRELRFLQIKHLDLYESIITLPAEITKNAQSRIVYIPEEFHKVLMIDYKLNTLKENLYIFTTHNKPGPAPVSKNYFWYHFDKLRKRLNIPNDYTFYGFKHTGAVAAVKHGANIHTIKEQMGHSSIAITEEYLKDKTGYEDDFFKRRMPAI